MERKLNKVSGLISIAKKAGYVIVGQDKLSGYDKKLYLILMDKSAGKSLVREMSFLSQKKNLHLQIVEDLENLVTIKNCKVIGIKNKALSEKIIESMLKGE